jgi:hypothetical protein
MKAKGKVKGILIEGSDGHEYLLWFGPAERTTAPILSRRQADGTFEPLTDTREASQVARAQLGTTGHEVIGPGWGKDLFLWSVFREALKAFPPVPSWPTWSSRDWSPPGRG